MGATTGLRHEACSARSARASTGRSQGRSPGLAAHPTSSGYSLGFTHRSVRTSDFLYALFCARFYLADPAGVDFELSLGAARARSQAHSRRRATERLTNYLHTLGHTVVRHLSY